MDEDRLQELHEVLTATGERPVERTASRWLGEAEAIAADVAHGEMTDDVRRERLEKVDHLLENVDGTGDPEADEHVGRAQDIVAELLA